MAADAAAFPGGLTPSSWPAANLLCPLPSGWQVPFVPPPAHRGGSLMVRKWGGRGGRWGTAQWLHQPSGIHSFLTCPSTITFFSDPTRAFGPWLARPWSSARPRNPIYARISCIGPLIDKKGALSGGKAGAFVDYAYLMFWRIWWRSLRNFNFAFFLWFFRQIPVSRPYFQKWWSLQVSYFKYYM